MSQENDGYAWVLVAMDVLSRYAWIVPLKHKSGPETARGLKSLFDRVAGDPQQHHHLPRILYVDKGSEFYNKDVKALLKTYPIPPELRSGNSTVKAALVERLQRTLKTRLWKHIHFRASNRWIEPLEQITEAYNNSIHKAHKRAPITVTRANDEEVWHDLYSDWSRSRHALTINHEQGRNPDIKFKVGDVVRISKQATIFKKGYLPQWSEEWFKIRTVDPGPPPYYRLEDYDGEDILEGTFYTQELQKVNPEEEKNMLFPIETILQKRTDPQTKREQVLVKYKGWPEKYNTWIDASQVESLGK